MIRECPNCGGAIPMDTRTRYEDGECPRCRFVSSPTTRTTDAETETETTTRTTPKALADGGRVVSE